MHPGVSALRYLPGQLFAPHRDRSANYPNRLYTSVVEVQSAPGARLELLDGWDGLISLAEGDLVIFDSGIMHEATPPLSGERISLVTWWSKP